MNPCNRHLSTSSASATNEGASHASGSEKKVWLKDRRQEATMPFFKELRRKKTGSKTEKSTDTSNNSNGSNGSNGAVPPSKSSSTLNSVYDSSTPPSSIQPNQSTPNLVTTKSGSTVAPLLNKSASTVTSLPQRPVPLSSVSNRSSFTVRT